MKVKASIAKNQPIFFEICIKNNILLKSLCLKAPIKSQALQISCCNLSNYERFFQKTMQSKESIPA